MGQIASNVVVTIGEVTMRVEFNIVEMDDFDVVLGHSWPRLACALLYPFGEQVLFMQDKLHRVKVSFSRPNPLPKPKTLLHATEEGSPKGLPYDSD